MSAGESRPNVLFIMDDQHRVDFLGCAGAGFLDTPNLDRLAARGVRFTGCCTNAPVCAPARIGLATGLHPWRLGSVGNQSYLPASVGTYYQRLRDAGFRVGCVGKLDLAKPDAYNGRRGDRPRTCSLGFTHPEECEGKMHGGLYPVPQGPYGYYLAERGLYEKFHADYQARRAKGWRIGAAHDSVLSTEDFEDCYIGRRAAEWIEHVPEEFPWHLFVSFVGPHDPFDPPSEYAERYRRAGMPEPISDQMGEKPGWVRSRLEPGSPEEVVETRRQYSALVTLIDVQIGRILEALERRGMSANTYVIFSSDHGEMLGDHGLYHKSVGYEPALRVPLIVAGPGIEPGRVSDALVELIDLNPTLCELAGLPEQEDIDARSLVPVLRGVRAEHRAEIVSALRNFRLIRTAGHKYIENYNDLDELYDLAADPQELHNLADQQPGLAGELRRRMIERCLEGQWRR